MDRLLAAIAFLAVFGFIGVLVLEVPRWDLGAVALLVITLLAVDFLSSLRKKS